VTQPRSAFTFVRQLQSALTVDEIEKVYLSAVRDVIFARGRGLYRVDDTTHTLVGQVADVPPRLLDEYATVPRGDDPVLETAISTRRPVASSERAVERQWMSSRACSVLMNSGFAHSLKAPLIIDATVWGSIHFTRFASDPPFNHNDRVAAAMVVDQLGLALDRALRHESAARRLAILEATLDCVPQPIIVTDHAGRPLHRNRAAKAATAATGRRVADLVASTIADAAELFDAENRRVVVSSVDHPAGEAMSVRSTRIRSHGATVSVVYPKEGGIGQALPALGILSRREQEIARFVSEGLSTSDIAARAFITENTVKQHLKRMFAKLNVRNRAELVQIIWSVTSGNSDGPPPTADNAPPPRRFVG
jgi:DNA-binding CsgD family transcriptional regulator/PAS domain-containing protein